MISEDGSIPQVFVWSAAVSSGIGFRRIFSVLDMTAWSGSEPKSVKGS